MTQPSPASRRKELDAAGCLRLSNEAACLDERSIGLIRQRKSQHVQRQVRSVAGAAVHTFCPVSFFGRRQLADIVTGSLYEGGRCLTGNLRIVPAMTKPAAQKSKARKASNAQVASGFAPDRIRSEKVRQSTAAQAAQGWTNRRRQRAA